MKRTMEQVHREGGHRDKRRPRCPLCMKPRPYMTATNRPAMSEATATIRKHWSIRPGFGYCTPAGIR